ncbi:MAG TPA: VanW family protein [Acidimicrobiia bacterium]|nr:VanW family protein [Acidimicrobiia bacterium]
MDLPRPVQLSLFVAASALAMIALVFGVDRMTNAGEVLGDVEVIGVELGGLDERRAIERLETLESHLLESPVVVEVAGHEFTLRPGEVHFDVRESDIVATAMQNGRSGNVANQFGWWLGRFGGDRAEVALAYDYDEDALAEIIRDWELEGIAQPAYPGEVWVEDGNVVYTYPAEGTGIERDAAMDLIRTALADPTRRPVTLPTRFLEPAVTSEDVDDAVVVAQQIISDDVTLSNSEHGTSVVIPRRVIADALEVALDETADEPSFAFSLRPEPIVDYVAALGPLLETEPVDAEILIDVETDEITLVPSIPVQEPDTNAITTAVWDAIEAGSRIGDLPYRVGREAEFSTTDAEDLGIKELIGEFTTFHACCQNRVINIQLIADLVDGVIIPPGEEFNLNDIVGRRTTAKGFVCAGAIVGGELVEEGEVCIGGGTSQFTTTMYNAAFFAGLEDISHTPHSIWFSRYPEGREATLGFPEPNLIFKNNTPNAIVVRTSHTSTSITAKIYGDNGGLVVEAGLSNRYNYTSPRGPIVRKNPELDLDGPGPGCSAADPLTVQNGTGGWSVDIYRYITRPDGTETTETWSWRYTGYYTIREYNDDDPDCVGPPPPPDP